MSDLGAGREKIRKGYRELRWDHPRVMASPIDAVELGSRAYSWVAEHRVVMAYELNRPLTSSEQVHHIDGNKLNNTPQNLVTFTPKEHTRHHQSLWKELLSAREELDFWRALGEHLDQARARLQKLGVPAG